MSVEQSEYRRLVPRQTWFQGTGVLLTVWSIVAALCLVGVVAVAYATIDLLVYQGRIEVAPADQKLLKPYVTEVRRGGSRRESRPAVAAVEDRDCPCASLVRTPLSRFIPFRSNRFHAGDSACRGRRALGYCGSGVLRRAAGCAQRISHSIGNTLRSQIHRQILRLGPATWISATPIWPSPCSCRPVTRSPQPSLGCCREAFTIWRLWSMVLALLMGLDWAITLQVLVPLILAYLLMQWVSARESLKTSRVESQGTTGLQTLSEGPPQEPHRPRLCDGGHRAGAVPEAPGTASSDYWPPAFRGDWASLSARLGAGLLLVDVGFLTGSRVLGTGQPLDLPKALTILGGLAALIPVIRVDCLNGARSANGRARRDRDQPIPRDPARSRTGCWSQVHRPRLEVRFSLKGSTTAAISTLCSKGSSCGFQRAV